MIKRTFDIMFSLFAITVFAIPMLIIAIIIKIKSPEGKIIFGHERIGKNKKPFNVYKFRTMIPDAENKLEELLSSNPLLREEFEKDFKLKNDPRIIQGIGNFLRKTSLDELPQFFNSLAGTLSIVGPRPIVENEIEKYGQYAKKLYTVKPGITGLWQIFQNRNDINYEQRVLLDMEYIDRASINLDIKIILKTIKVMIFKEGI